MWKGLFRQTKNRQKDSYKKNFHICRTAPHQLHQEENKTAHGAICNIIIYKNTTPASITEEKRNTLRQTHGTGTKQRHHNTPLKEKHQTEDHKDKAHTGIHRQQKHY